MEAKALARVSVESSEGTRNRTTHPNGYGARAPDAHSVTTIRMHISKTVKSAVTRLYGTGHRLGDHPVKDMGCDRISQPILCLPKVSRFRHLPATEPVRKGFLGRPPDVLSYLCFQPDTRTGTEHDPSRIVNVGWMGLLKWQI